MFSGLRRILQKTGVRHASTGLVGYPNVGKSTLFNALAQTQAAEASNYPFCTIEPNIAKVAVYDANILALQTACKPKKTTPAQIQVWDIAGLIRGASKGAGLGNKFLSNIRSVTVVLHVLRCFKDDAVVHVDDVTKLDPISELEAVETELLLSDIEMCERKAKRVMILFTQRGLSTVEQGVWVKVFAALNQGTPAREVPLEAEEQKILATLPLLTAKPAICVCNVDHNSAAEGNDLSERVASYLQEKGRPEPIVLSALLEQEAAVMKADGDSQQEQQKIYQQFLEAYGLQNSGLWELTRRAAEVLGLQLFYTAGPTQVSSWFVRQGALAPEAAGKIHSSFEKGFICAEVCKVQDYVQLGEEKKIREARRMVRKGKEYTMEPDDVVLFKAASASAR